MSDTTVTRLSNVEAFTIGFALCALLVAPFGVQTRQTIAALSDELHYRDQLADLRDRASQQLPAGVVAGPCDLKSLGGRR